MRDALAIFPDLTSCQLAVMCRHPCREVRICAHHWKIGPSHMTFRFRLCSQTWTQNQTPSRVAQMVFLILRPKICPVSKLSSTNLILYRKPSTAIPFSFFLQAQYSRPPCQHSGPCGANNCSCFAQSIQCQRTCSCTNTCEFSTFPILTYHS